MDPNSGLNPQTGVAEEDSQISETQATIDWNILDPDMLQTPVDADDPYLNMSTEPRKPPSVSQAGLYGESERLSQSGTRVPLETFVSSSVFFSYRLYCNQPPDTMLYSSDRVCFYTHSFLLLSVSNNNFGGLIHNDYSASFNNPLVLSVATPSDVLDISLRAIYMIGIPPAPPAFSTFESAVRFLKQHGVVPLSEWIGRASHMFTALTSFTPQYALELYTLGAEFDIEPLAVHASSFLLTRSLSSIPEEMAERIGGVYMKRLGNLQISRIDALKDILLPGPPTHPIRGNECSEERQGSLGRSYALTVAFTCWDANADLPASFIEETLWALSDKLDCPMCKDGLDRRIKESVEAWTTLKRTI